MGKYYDDYEREADYQNWLFYRESSHEERAFPSESTHSNGELNDNLPKVIADQVQSSLVDVFRDYPEHRELISTAEKIYFESQRNDKVVKNE